MAGLAAARKIEQYDGPDWLRVGVKADAVIYHGAMVGLSTTGIQAVPASASVVPLGVADLQAWDDQAKQGQASTFNVSSGSKIDNTGGADGARSFVIRRGVFKMNNKAGDLVTTAHRGMAVYVEDDQTVRATAAGSVKAGVLIMFDDRDGLPLVAIGSDAFAITYGRA